MSDNRVFRHVGELEPSEDAYELIRESEGLRLAPYICPAGHPTIGYGRKLQKLTDQRPITREQAESYLYEDAQEASRNLKALIKVPITQGMFDALISFVYNFGAPKLKSSTLLRLLNAKDYEGAERQFDMWVGRPNNNGNPLPGLVIRRDKEEDLFDRK